MRPTLRLAPPLSDLTAVDPLVQMAGAFRTIADLLPLLAASRPAARMVSVLDVVPAKKKRAAYAACRVGAVAGAVKIAREWHATEESITAWLRTLGPRLVTPLADEQDDLEATRRRLASPGRRRTR